MPTEDTFEIDADGLLEVRSTIHLPGIGPGDVVLVDPAEPYIADCLRAGYLVPFEGPASSGD